MTILCATKDGRVSLDTIKSGFQFCCGPMLGGYSFAVSPDPKGFDSVYLDSYTSAHFVKFVQGMDANARFNV